MVIKILVLITLLSIGQSGFTEPTIDENINDIQQKLDKLYTLQQQIQLLETKIIQLQLLVTTNITNLIEDTETHTDIVLTTVAVVTEPTVLTIDSNTHTPIGNEPTHKTRGLNSLIPPISQQTIQPWNPDGYKQSVERATKTYYSEEAAKCDAKIRKYQIKYHSSPKNEFYKYKLYYWQKKCAELKH